MNNTSSRLLRHLLVAAALTGATTLAQADDSTTTAPRQDFVSLVAKANLTQQGIANPTAAELSKATDDVAALRASGMGWGAIANSLGLRLGEVVSAANRAQKAEDPGSASAAGKAKSVAARSGDTPGASHGGLGGNAGGQGGGKGGGNGGGKGGGGGKR